tara:strand:+ start:1949 stop:2347 length:399 start_codon:yes stop_codon:yes gene_type:complete
VNGSLNNAVHKLMIDRFQQAAAGFDEVLEMRGLLVSAKGFGVLPLFNHDEAVGLLLMAVQVVLQATGFGLAEWYELTQAGLNSLRVAGQGGEGGNKGDWARHTWAPVQEVAMLGYLIDEKNSLQLESLSILF